MSCLLEKTLCVLQGPREVNSKRAPMGKKHRGYWPSVPLGWTCLFTVNRPPPLPAILSLN